jgi:hypothetical protein
MESIPRRSDKNRADPSPIAARSDIPSQVRRAPPLDDHEIDAWLAAIEHLADVGLRGLVPDDVRANDRFRCLVAQVAAS